MDFSSHEVRNVDEKMELALMSYPIFKKKKKVVKFKRRTGLPDASQKTIISSIPIGTTSLAETKSNFGRSGRQIKRKATGNQRAIGYFSNGADQSNHKIDGYLQKYEGHWRSSIEAGFPLSDMIQTAIDTACCLFSLSHAEKLFLARRIESMAKEWNQKKT